MNDKPDDHRSFLDKRIKELEEYKGLYEKNYEKKGFKVSFKTCTFEDYENKKQHLSPYNIKNVIGTLFNANPSENKDKNMLFVKWERIDGKEATYIVRGYRVESDTHDLIEEMLRDRLRENENKNENDNKNKDSDSKVDSKDDLNKLNL